MGIKTYLNQFILGCFFVLFFKRDSIYVWNDRFTFKKKKKKNTNKQIEKYLIIQ